MPLPYPTTSQRASARFPASSGKETREPDFTRNIRLDDFLDQAANTSEKLTAAAALLRELAKATMQAADAVSLGYIAEAIGHGRRCE